MHTNLSWRKRRNVFLPSIALAGICVIASATIVAWSVTLKAPLNDLKLKFNVYSIWRGEFTGPNNHAVESVRIGLNLTVRNPWGFDSPPILFEEPSVLLNGWKLDIKRINCQATAEAARVVDQQTVTYIELCDTLQPLTIRANQTVSLPLDIWVYNNTDNLSNAIWSAQGGSFNATLSGSLNVRPYFTLSQPYLGTKDWWSQVLWSSRDFNMTATFAG